MQRSTKSLLHHPKQWLALVQPQVAPVQGAFRSLGPKDLLHPLLTTFWISYIRSLFQVLWCVSQGSLFAAARIVEHQSSPQLAAAAAGAAAGLKLHTVANLTVRVKLFERGLAPLCAWDRQTLDRPPIPWFWWNSPRASQKKTWFLLLFLRQFSANLLAEHPE